MPSTSPSWSTLVNRPLASRQAMIAAAVTGPMPGNVSSSSTVAAFRSTKPPGVGVFPAVGGASVGAAVAGPELIELPIAAGCPGRRDDPDDDLFTVGDSPGHVQPDQVGTVQSTTGRGERIGDPCTRRQRDKSRLVHEAHHADDHRSVGVGWRGSGVGLADETISTGGSFADATGGGLSRTRVKTVTSTAMTPTTANAMTPARPGSARIAATQPAVPSGLVVSGSHRDSDVSGSPSPSPSASATHCRHRDGAAVARRAIRFACGQSRRAVRPPGHLRVPATRPVDEIPSVDSRVVYSDSIWIVVFR